MFRASAPGSLMLLGEYGVLHGGHAVVCAVDKRMSVSLTPRTDRKIEITSALGNFSTTLSQLKPIFPFQFVLSVLKRYRKHLKTGCDIVITSEFSDKMGFASSAAVTVALIAALSKWLDFSWNEIQILQASRKIIQSVQGVGSGADVAACVFGGVIAYRKKPFFVEKLPHLFALTIIYSGSKTPTVEAIEQVKKNFSVQPVLFKQLCRAIDMCALNGIQFIHKQDWTELGKTMNIQQGLMESLGVNTPILKKIIMELQNEPNILGVKISGSGLGDCVIGLGKKINFHSRDNIFPIEADITTLGVQFEKI